MRNFVFKSILFVLPFILALMVELFVLPIDFFTFRVWEALSIRKFNYILSGEFYPNVELTKIEEGDLVHHTKYTYKRKVQWFTDRYGYRKRNTERKRNEIVIIGDSNIAGSGLTQDNIPSEVLERKLKRSVYPVSPSSLNSFFKQRRFRKSPPDIIIISSIERFMSYLPPVKISSRNISAQWQSKIREIGYRIRDQISGNRFVQFAGVYLDRLYKQNMLLYLRASLRRTASSDSIDSIKPISSKYGSVFFLQGADANKDVPREQFERILEVIKGYDEVLKSKGIRFIFLPIPEKENIYYECLKTRKPIFLKQLISALKNLGIETVDTQIAFDDAFRNGVLLYHTNDTHWNENAVKITADLLAKEIEKKDKNLRNP